MINSAMNLLAMLETRTLTLADDAQLSRMMKRGCYVTHTMTVCREKYLRSKQMNFQAEDKDLPKCCKTVYRCKYCEEFLCIGKSDSNCWFD
uniref:Uncharacterized protein n=1 Tax=Octopus bimaculoides TaxID=37653 RepID=A0A0L8I9B3_OCTBM